MAFIFGITLASVLWDAHGLIKRVSMAEVQVELFTKDCLVSNGDLFYVGKNEDKWIAGCKVKESVVAQ